MRNIIEKYREEKRNKLIFLGTFSIMEKYKEAKRNENMSAKVRDLGMNRVKNQWLY